MSPTTKKKDMSDGHPTIIGNDVTVGHRVMLHGCTIEDACLIGMSATILDGAVIGKESIVGAGALVTKNKKLPSPQPYHGKPCTSSARTHGRRSQRALRFRITLCKV